MSIAESNRVRCLAVHRFDEGCLEPLGTTTVLAANPVWLAESVVLTMIRLIRHPAAVAGIDTLRPKGQSA